MCGHCYSTHMLRSELISSKVYVFHLQLEKKHCRREIQTAVQRFGKQQSTVVCTRWRLKSWSSGHDGDLKAPPAAKYTNTASQKSASTTRNKSAGHACSLPVSAWGCCCFAAEHTGQHSPSGVSVVWQSPTSSQTTSSHNTVPLSHKHTRQGSGLHIWSLG